MKGKVEFEGTMVIDSIGFRVSIEFDPGPTDPDKLATFARQLAGKLKFGHFVQKKSGVPADEGDLGQPHTPAQPEGAPDSRNTQEERSGVASDRVVVPHSGAQGSGLEGAPGPVGLMEAVGYDDCDGVYDGLVKIFNEMPPTARTIEGSHNAGKP